MTTSTLLAAFLAELAHPTEATPQEYSALLAKHGLHIPVEFSSSANPLLDARLIVWTEGHGWMPTQQALDALRPGGPGLALPTGVTPLPFLKP